MSSDPEPMPGSPDETEGTIDAPDEAATRAEVEAEAEALSQEGRPQLDDAARRARRRARAPGQPPRP